HALPLSASPFQSQLGASQHRIDGLPPCLCPLTCNQGLGVLSPEKGLPAKRSERDLAGIPFPNERHISGPIGASVSTAHAPLLRTLEREIHDLPAIGCSGVPHQLSRFELGNAPRKGSEPDHIERSFGWRWREHPIFTYHGSIPEGSDRNTRPQQRGTQNIRPGGRQHLSD